MSKELEFGTVTLGKADDKTLEAEQLEHLAEMVYMNVQIRTEDQDIINLNKKNRRSPRI